MEPRLLPLSPGLFNHGHQHVPGRQRAMHGLGKIEPGEAPSRFRIKRQVRALRVDPGHDPGPIRLAQQGRCVKRNGIAVILIHMGNDGRLALDKVSRRRGGIEKVRGGEIGNPPKAFDDPPARGVDRVIGKIKRGAIVCRFRVLRGKAGLGGRARLAGKLFCFALQAHPRPVHHRLVRVRRLLRFVKQRDTRRGLDMACMHGKARDEQKRRAVAKTGRLRKAGEGRLGARVISCNRNETPAPHQRAGQHAE